MNTTFFLPKPRHTCMECPVGLRGNLKVSLKDGSLSCRQTLVFFLMILFWVATFTTYSLTYRSDDTFNKWWRSGLVTSQTLSTLPVPSSKPGPHLAGDLGSWTCKWCFCTEESPRPAGPLLSSPPSSEQPWFLPSLEFYHLKTTWTVEYNDWMYEKLRSMSEWGCKETALLVKISRHFP